jgi:hypothetical protein
MTEPPPHVKNIKDFHEGAATLPEQAVKRQRFLGSVVLAGAAAAFICSVIFGRDFFGWFPMIPPGAKQLILELSYWALGIGLGMSVGMALAWQDARKIIDFLGDKGGRALEAMLVQLSALQLSHKSMERIISDLTGRDTDGTGFIKVTPRMIELCHALDADAFIAEIPFSDGTVVENEHHALLLMHGFRQSHPAFTPEERMVSEKWLQEHGVFIDPPDLAPEKMN